MITTIIPTFQRPGLLVRAVRSVLDQEFAGVAVQIYDNASADETRSVAEELMRLDPRVSYHRHDANIGSVENFNFALGRVKTRYFSLLSDDDILLPGFYQAATTGLEAAPRAGFYCGRTAICNPETRAVTLSREWPAGLYAAGEDAMLRMIRSHFPWNGVLWRRRVLDTVSRLDQFGSDDNFIVKASLRHDFIVSDRVAAVLFLHPDGLTGGLLAGSARLDSGSVSPYIEHLIGRPRRLQEDLAAEPDLAASIVDRARQALRLELRRDLLSHFLFKSLPSGRAREMDVIRTTLREDGIAPHWRALLAALRANARAEGRMARLQAAAAKSIVARRDARRQSLAKRDPEAIAVWSNIERANARAESSLSVVPREVSIAPP